MKIRRIMLTVLAIACGAMLAACGAKPAPEEEAKAVVVGFSQLGSESAWRIGNTASMEAAAREYGYGLMMENANQKQEKQISAIRSFIAYRVDVIVVSPIVEKGWENVLREAREAGIPVILMDRMVAIEDDSLYTAYIGADFMEEGRKAGEFLLRKADSLNRDHLNVAEISGTLGSTPMRERQQGFWRAIEGDGRFTVLESVSGDFLRSKGGECMRYLLDKYGAEGIDVIYSHNDAMTLGALDVLEAEGIAPGKDVVIISVDGEQAAVDALAEGKINCIVECTPNLGNDVMEMVGALTRGEAVPKTMHPQERVFTEFDDLSGLEPRGY